MQTHLIRTLQLSRLGFGLFWSMPFAMLLGLPGINAPSFDWLLFVWVNQLSIAAGIPLCAKLLSLSKAAPTSSPLPFLAGGLLSASGFLYTHCFTLGNSLPILSVLTGVVLGFSCSLCYLLWNTVYANEGQARSAIYLPVAGVLTVAFCLVLMACPDVAVSFSLIVALPCLAAYALWCSMRDMDPVDGRPMRPYFANVVADLWKPVLCATAVCFVQSLSGHIPSLYDGGIILAMPCGLGAACLVVAVAGLKSTHDFGTHSAYIAMFPLIGIVLFIPALFGEQWMPVMMGTLTFGSRIMLLLIFILCASYAARTQFSPISTYLVCAYPLHIAGFVGDTVGFLMVAQNVANYTSAMRIPVICLVVCFFGLAIASFGKKPHSLVEPADDTLLINPPPCADGRVGQKGHRQAECPESTLGPRADGEAGPLDVFDLSSREREVVDLLLKGNTLAAISRKLVISENTTRGHMKRIYRKLDVHSRQELIDLVEKKGVNRNV